ncbi:expressed unknown protein [Seminavis robusta]|uniref:Uncharacterized protein n=1 Tax=Seminavis robusta TaxID=568900 RepID=A0A9N8HCE6_9STRA|nr:expressed unknown protein [Seminavis robusta]|eukprot:Sro405_g136270.1 n/a (515) ;mRNA; r:60216-61760
MHRALRNAASDLQGKERIPQGVTHNLGERSHPSQSIRGIQRGADHTSTFDVTPKHESIAKGDGVRFNVETVPSALKEHLQKPPVSRPELIEGLQAALAETYTRDRGEKDSDGYPIYPGEPGSVMASDVRMEALSEIRGDKTLVHAGSNGLVMAMVTAFAQHLPLELSPDSIWVAITYAFAKHVDQNAGALRKNFVQHEGKKRLEVETNPSFAMSRGGDPDTGASAEKWETEIFPAFSSQIKEHIGKTTHEAIAASFTTTTATAKACHEITLMSAMKNYFSYGMRTMCGIPQITLLGAEDDWVQLRARTEHLGSLMTAEFSEYWMPLLLPLLDEFVESYKGNVNHGFWQSMVKLRNTGGGSGTYNFISGWMQILFPYLGSGSLNENLKPWHEMYFYGPKLGKFPPLASSAPVDWDYHGTTFDIEFFAGVIGFAQDNSNGALSPVLGWYVAHAPPKSPSLQLKEAKKELNDLLLGHEEEASAEIVDKSAPWYGRVTFLQDKILKLESTAPKQCSSF